jgi:hypothetical protein
MMEPSRAHSFSLASRKAAIPTTAEGATEGSIAVAIGDSIAVATEGSIVEAIVVVTGGRLVVARAVAGTCAHAANIVSFVPSRCVRSIIRT